jgi:signal transduction histidine kinase/DNA-binding NarL/FixJ family response regulator
MLLPGTQMHIVTFIFVSIEIVIFFYLLIYRLARPDDANAYLNIILIFLLLIYNITGGLLPDPNLPGSVFMQESIAYGTGFITPCFFPYYVYKSFALEKMEFHAHKGVFFFLMLPYFIFVLVYAISGKLTTAKDLLGIPVVYALWVIITLIKSIRYKYKNDFSGYESKEELVVLLLSLTPWIGLPVIDFFDLGQAEEACITNGGFLLLFAFEVKTHIENMRKEHERLIASEKRLLTWNSSLKTEVDKRTKELELINEQRTNTLVNLAHETKTPLTLINNYLEEYITKNDPSEELDIVKRNLNKLSADIVNLFDLEKFNKGFAFYNHELVSNFSAILKDSVVLFKGYALKNKIALINVIPDEIFIKADPLAIHRIVNNLLENAVKFSNEGNSIEVILLAKHQKIQLSVKDNGIGIPIDKQQKIFEPYFQLNHQKSNTQGMGLGLPIVKKVVDDLKGEIKILSNPKTYAGTVILISLNQYIVNRNEVVQRIAPSPKISLVKNEPVFKETIFDEAKETILIVEDNTSMINFLIKKLGERYNIYSAVNGNEAIKKLKAIPVLADLIITDIMMEKMDGYEFAKIISKSSSYAHIPFIFLSAKTAFNDKLKGLKLGAIDYLPKPFSISELLQKIDSILLYAGKQKRVIWNKAFNIVNSNNNLLKKGTLSGAFEQNCELYHLTTREKDIAKLICQGQKYKNIGETLFIAERTVTKHAQNIFEKTQVSNKIELINKLELA